MLWTVTSILFQQSFILLFPYKRGGGEIDFLIGLLWMRREEKKLLLWP
jgi:hypothetical protein